MKYRVVGKSGLKISEIGFGAAGIGGVWEPPDDVLSRKTLNLAFDLGVNFFDTAFAYGNGHSERMIGRFIHSRKIRDKVVVATKIPGKHHRQAHDRSKKAQHYFSGPWIRKITEESLRNFKTDYIDLQQLHDWSPNWLHEGGWLSELQKLKREGKIRFIGVSVREKDSASAIDLVRSGSIDFIQTTYNIFDQSAREPLFALCQAKNIGIIVRIPLDQGGLSGKLTTKTRFAESDWRHFYFGQGRLEATCARVERLKPLLLQAKMPLSELALRFCLAHEAVSTVIPGMSQPKHARRNCRVSDGKKLSANVLKKLIGEDWPDRFGS